MPHKDPDVRREYNKNYSKVYREANREKLKEKSIKYYEENKHKKIDQKREYQKKYREENKAKAREDYKKYSQTEFAIKARRIKNWKLMGIKCDDFEAIYALYIITDKCDYCDCDLTNGCRKKNFRCLDHDHSTGEIRGILCWNCNIHDVYKNN